MTDAPTMDAQKIERNVAHGIFTVERTYPDVTPRRVFEAFATEKGKESWFSGPNDRWERVERVFDFRIGGTERLVGKWPSGMVTEFDATYLDIVPGERIVYVYEMHLDRRKISVSLATLEFKAAGGGTRFVMTEQGAFLDGFDDAGGRERGANEIVDKLGESLRRAL
ncbi:MAG: SRPBCC family protein [Phenylobacterium sp.]